MKQLSEQEFRELVKEIQIDNDKEIYQAYTYDEEQTINFYYNVIDKEINDQSNVILSNAQILELTEILEERYSEDEFERTRSPFNQVDHYDEYGLNPEMFI